MARSLIKGDLIGEFGDDRDMVAMTVIHSSVRGYHLCAKIAQYALISSRLLLGFPGLRYQLATHTKSWQRHFEKTLEGDVSRRLKISQTYLLAALKPK
eukprot:3038632-Pyramimonas_sp.AAC.1